MFELCCCMPKWKCIKGSSGSFHKSKKISFRSTSNVKQTVLLTSKAMKPLLYSFILTLVFFGSQGDLLIFKDNDIERVISKTPSLILNRDFNLSAHAIVADPLTACSPIANDITGAIAVISTEGKTNTTLISGTACNSADAIKNVEE